MKYILVLLLSVLVHASSMAQSEGSRIGFRFGLGQSRINNAQFEDQRGSMALSTGLTYAYQFNRNFGLTTDLLYTTKGSSNEGFAQGNVEGQTFFPRYKENYSMNYLELPVMGKVSFGIQNVFIKAFAGPSINYNLTAKQNRSFDNNELDRELGFENRDLDGRNRLEFAGVFGAGVDFQRANERIISLDFRNSQAFVPAGQINSRNIFNNYWAISVGYLY